MNNTVFAEERSLTLVCVPETGLATYSLETAAGQRAYIRRCSGITAC